MDPLNSFFFKPKTEISSHTFQKPENFSPFLIKSNLQIAFLYQQKNTKNVQILYQNEQYFFFLKLGTACENIMDENESYVVLSLHYCDFLSSLSFGKQKIHRISTDL